MGRKILISILIGFCVISFSGCSLMNTSTGSWFNAKIVVHGVEKESHAEFIFLSYYTNIPDYGKTKIKHHLYYKDELNDYIRKGEYLESEKIYKGNYKVDYKSDKEKWNDVSLGVDNHKIDKGYYKIERKTVRLNPFNDKTKAEFHVEFIEQ